MREALKSDQRSVIEVLSLSWWAGPETAKRQHAPWSREMAWHTWLADKCGLSVAESVAHRRGLQFGWRQLRPTLRRRFPYGNLGARGVCAWRTSGLALLRHAGGPAAFSPHNITTSHPQVS